MKRDRLTDAEIEDQIDHVLDLDRQICLALYTAQRAFTRAYGPLLEPLGLTYPQYLVMLALWARDGRAIGELGDCLGLDSGTLTPLLKRMAQHGLVTRSRDEADERVVKIRLTPAGRAMHSRARKIPIELAERAGYDLGSRKDVGALGALRDELTALAQRIEANTK